MDPRPARRAEAPGRWLKGNLHTHPFWSDGDDYPERILQGYKERGHDFVALSEHNTLAEGERWIDVERHLEAEGASVLYRYSDEIGEVLAEVRGDRPSYAFQGDEMYVRSRIVSSELKENPYRAGEHEAAWVQPVVPHR